MAILAEIKRRKMFQVAAVYAVTAWLLVQIVATVEEPLRLPGWADSLVIVLLGVGFPIALILSWAFNLTPEGLVRERPSTEAPPATGRTIEYVLIGVLIMAVGWLVYRDVKAPVSAAGGTVLPNSIAVLPCSNLSPDPDNAYFAAGIHEEVLNQLVKIRGLNVIARTSVLPYAGAARPITDIARELRVGTVMECSVSYAEGRVAIAAQLIKASTGVHLWSERYNRELVDVFGIQVDIARNIAAALETTLSPAESRALERQPTSSAEAYALYLRAIDQFRSSSGAGGLAMPPAASAALHEHLDRALEVDPEFALAYATKARDYAYSMVRPRKRSDPVTTDEREKLVLDNARKAIEIDPNLGLAYAALATLHRFRWREREARQAYEQALELSPNDPLVIFDFAIFNAHTGNSDEANRLGRRLVQISPNQGHLLLSIILIQAGQFSEAAGAARRSVERSPESGHAQLYLAHAEAMRANPREARAALRAAEAAGVGTDNPFELAQIIYTYHRIGAPDEARRVLGRLSDVAERYEVGPGEWSLAYLSIGAEERALAYLEEAAASRPTDSGWALLARIASNAYDDPTLTKREFAEVRRRLGFRE